MYMYYTNKDLPITITAHGVINFDRDLINKKLSRNFATPKWVKGKLDKILNDEVFVGVSNDDILPIINSRVLHLNEALVPLMRTSLVENNDLSKFVKMPDVIRTDDIHLSLAATRSNEPPFVNLETVELTEVFNRLYKLNITIDDDDQKYITEQVMIVVEAFCRDVSIARLNTEEKYISETEDLKQQIAYQVGMALINRITPVVYRYMLDNTTTSPYFYLNEDCEVVVDESKIYYLLDAMEYAALDEAFNPYENVKESIHAICDSLTEEIRNIMSEKDDNKLSDIERGHLSLSTNLSALNSIKFMRDNDIELSRYSEIITPDILMSQGCFEMLYMDAINEMLLPEAVIEDLHRESGREKYTLHDTAKEIIEEVGSTFRSMVDNGSAIHNLYEGTLRTYTQMVRMKTRKTNSVSNYTSGSIKLNSYM